MTQAGKQFSSDSVVYDCIGVGFGPSNIALAIAMEEQGSSENILFLEKAPAPDWQGEFSIDGSDIQHHPLRDFVTPRNPASPYGFLSYLKAKGRLFDFLNLEAPFPPRSEYARYVVWVARQFDHVVRYSTEVRSISYAHADTDPVIRVESVDGRVYFAHSLSFAPGRSNHVPEPFASHMGDRMIHATQYRSAVARWQYEGDVRSVAIIGASQTAVEIMLDLPHYLSEARITAVLRSFGIKQKDLSPFTERIYEPEFVDQFYSAPEEMQAILRQELWRSNYSAADHDVIRALQLKLYEQKVTGRDQLAVIDNKVTRSVVGRDGGRGWTLTLSDRLSGDLSEHQFDAIILATGFLNHGRFPGAEPYHPLLAKVAEHASFRKDGAIAQARDYRILLNDPDAHPPIFLNGVSETTHGFGDAGSFSLLSVRSHEIATAIREGMSQRGRSTALDTIEDAVPLSQSA